ncbi:MAG TPA: glycine zipper 2TM domain-containing protein [Methylophilaceae bacterium]|nr:glycine zipper 2TM domain-containing protein [Methylophilaceae bacterium]HQR60686.1 glycine zipper 2TM domain-containing protein [Methylophilaceae bacterium]
MRQHYRSLLLAVSFLAMLAGCASPGGSPSQPAEIRQGKIEQITEIEINENNHPGLGAIIGGIAGAGIGSLIGQGTGKDVAIAVGAIGGAVGGNYLQNKHDKQPGQQIVVRLRSGVLVVVSQPTNANLYVGQPVYVEGAGMNATVVPQ